MNTVDLRWTSAIIKTELIVFTTKIYYWRIHLKHNEDLEIFSFICQLQDRMPKNVWELNNFIWDLARLLGDSCTTISQDMPLDNLLLLKNLAIRTAWYHLNHKSTLQTTLNLHFLTYIIQNLISGKAKLRGREQNDNVGF